MRHQARLRIAAITMALLAPAAIAATATADGPDGPDAGEAAPTVRFATFNASLNRFNSGDLAAELATPGSAQPDTIAEIIQRARPDVLLINEFDYDPAALDSFRANYLEVAHGDADPISYPYTFIAPSNTGVFSGFDYDNSGAAGDFVPNDSYGFGFFEGQFGMAVLSMYPIDHDAIRTFQLFKWKDMPGALLPDDLDTPEPGDWYTPGDELDSFRLSSKSHWDVPIQIEDATVHFLVSHPTPPVFDGPEDRNGTRNHDEIRFWADYVGPGRNVGSYIYDDDGNYGGLKPGSMFVIAGDQNSDPARRRQHPRVGPTAARPSARQHQGHPVKPRSGRAVGACRAARICSTSATRHSTPPTSATSLRATCAPTTCCRARTCGSPTPRCSGPNPTTRCSRSWGRSRSRARTTAWSGSTSPTTTSAEPQRHGNELGVVPGALSRPADPLLPLAQLATDLAGCFDAGADPRRGVRAVSGSVAGVA